jgi:Zn-dependent protease with chaperone function
VDRRHFLDEQQRNRRKSRRFFVFAIVAVVVAGIPLCVVASPLIFGVVLIGANLWDLVSPLSAHEWSALRRTAFALPEVWNAVRGRSAEVPWGPLALLLVTPGALLMLIAWPFMRRLQRLAGSGAVLELIPSRDIDASVLAEQQLANVVHEMAVSANVPVPRVRIIESPAVNVVAIGLTTDDATILASEGFLATLNRDERQAMVAHLIGSVGNGDLEIAAIILSVIETWGLVSATFEAVLWTQKRKLVGRFVRTAGRSLRGTASRDEARSVVNGFLGAGMPDPIEGAMGGFPENLWGVLFAVFILVPMLATIGLASIAARTAASLFTAIGFGPWVAAMWRARRRLADASAVQLTRNPTALAGAVRKLGDADVVIPAGWVVNFLFPVWVPVTEQHAASAVGAAEILGTRLETEPRLAHLAVLGAQLDAPLKSSSLLERVREELPDVGKFVGWALLCIAICAVLLLVSWLLATALLWGLWVVLGWIFGPLRWVRGRVA